MTVFSSPGKVVSATVFLSKIFSPAAGWLIYELHLGILFSLKKLSERHYLVVFLFTLKKLKSLSFELHSYSPSQPKRTLFLFVVRAQVLCFLFFQDTFWFLWKQNNQEKKKKVQTKKRFVSAKLSDKRNILLFCFFFVYLIFNFISPNVCHWDMFFWKEATEFTVTETIIFPFFFCK